MSYAKASHLMRIYLNWAADAYLALRRDGFDADAAARIVAGAFSDRLPPVIPYEPEPAPRTDTEPPQ